MLLSFSTADAVGIRSDRAQLVRLKAGQLPEVKTVLEQQNAIELVPTAYIVYASQGTCDRGLKPPWFGGAKRVATSVDE